MNFLTGEVGPSGDSFRRGDLSVALAGRFAAGHKTILGVRPEDCAPAEGAAADIEGRVTLVSPLGSEQHVNLAVGDTELVFRLDKGLRVAPGDRLGLCIPRDRLHLFDAASEERLDGARP